jgi:hypothetical protein
VHPESGVVFAVALGTIGVFLRLPLDAMIEDETMSTVPYRLSSVEPEWKNPFCPDKIPQRGQADARILRSGPQQLQQNSRRMAPAPCLGD